MGFRKFRLWRAFWYSPAGDKFMSRHTGQRTSEGRIARPWDTQEIVLYKDANAFAMDIDRRQDFAVTNVRPTERPWVT